jgi:ATP adenylyltransferase
MEWLHAPWRIEYILAPKSDNGDGLFTRIGQSQDDEENLVIARERSCFAVLNRYPYSGGHLMVVPYKEAKDLNDLTDEELTDVMRLLRRCQNAMAAVLRPDGFNIGINLGRVAGAVYWATCMFTSCPGGTATLISCRCSRTPGFYRRS